MNQLRIQKLAAAISEAKVDHVLLTSLASLRYFAGYSAGIETGPSPFSPVLGAFLWIAAEQPRLFLADMESSEEIVPGLEVTTFASYTVEKPLSAAKDLALKLRACFEKLPAGRVGIEADDLPAGVLEPLRSGSMRLEFQDFAAALAKIRMVKDEEEISILREALDLCDLGQTLVKNSAGQAIHQSTELM